MSRRSHRYLVRRFPYGIIYQPHAGDLYILAVADLRRRPKYWRRRELK